MKKLILTLALAIIATFTTAQAQVAPQVGDQVLSNSEFTESTPVYSGGVLFYSKPVDWACPTYRNGPYGSYCDYVPGKLAIMPYRTTNRLQPSGYWYQRVYLEAGTYDIEGSFSATGTRDGTQGVVVTIGPGGPTATHPQALRFMSNEPAGVKSGVWRVATSGYYYVTIAAAGYRQPLTNSSKLFIDHLSMVYTGL